MITIGSDPEFAIIDSNRERVDAYHLFDEVRYRSCGHTRTTSCPQFCSKPNLYCGHNTISAEIGSDCGFGELRPIQGNTPLEHRDNIEHLIKVMEIPEGYKLLAGTRWSSSGLGGHIHFGMSHISLPSLSCFLSYYCGLLLKKIENPDDLKIRGLTPGNYGYFANYHDKSYGIEWRMPASWLISREITTASLCLAYVVASQYSICNDHKNYLQDYEYKDLIKSDMLSIIAEVEKMDVYKYYRGEIEPIFQMIINGTYWNTSHDFREGWP